MEVQIQLNVTHPISFVCLKRYDLYRIILPSLIKLFSLLSSLICSWLLLFSIFQHFLRTHFSSKHSWQSFIEKLMSFLGLWLHLTRSLRSVPFCKARLKFYLSRPAVWPPANSNTHGYLRRTAGSSTSHTTVQYTLLYYTLYSFLDFI